MACGLLIPPQIHFVLPRHLPCDPQACVLPSAVIKSLMAIIWVIGPLGYVAGIFVAPQRDILPVALVARSPVEPEPVLYNRAPKRAIDVPEFLKLVGSASQRRAEPACNCFPAT